MNTQWFSLETLIPGLAMSGATAPSSHIGYGKRAGAARFEKLPGAKPSSGRLAQFAAAGGESQAFATCVWADIQRPDQPAHKSDLVFSGSIDRPVTTFRPGAEPKVTGPVAHRGECNASAGFDLELGNTHRFFPDETPVMRMPCRPLAGRKIGVDAARNATLRADFPRLSHLD